MYMIYLVGPWNMYKNILYLATKKYFDKLKGIEILQVIFFDRNPTY